MDTFQGREIVWQAIVGSQAHNLATPESDVDYKYFVTPSFDDLYSGKFFATANVSQILDYDAHDIRKFGELIWKANINFVAALFRVLYCGEGLEWIVNNADKLAMMNLPAFYHATMGMHYEKMSSLLKGTGNTQVLVDRFGYDTKQATHALRCAMVVGRVSDGMSVQDALYFKDGDANRTILMNVKAGKYTLDEFEKMTQEFRVHALLSKSWFMAQKANKELREELNSIIKQAVKLNL